MAHNRFENESESRAAVSCTRTSHCGESFIGICLKSSSQPESFGRTTCQNEKFKHFRYRTQCVLCDDYVFRKKNRRCVSSQRIEAENRIAAFYEENVRRRGEGNTATPTLGSCKLFTIPLDALIQCLNGLGPEVQLLMTALSLGTSSIGDILLLEFDDVSWKSTATISKSTQRRVHLPPKPKRLHDTWCVSTRVS